MTATERFKALLANALERVCVLEAELEQTQARLAELEAAARQQAEASQGETLVALDDALAALDGEPTQR
jgi:hypothetical protein